MRRIGRVLGFLLAIVLLIEAWLLDYTRPLIARLTALLLVERAKTWIARVTAPLPPWVVLAIFSVPLIVVEPFKLVALWFIAKGHFVTGVVTFVVAEVAGACGHRGWSMRRASPN